MRGPSVSKCNIKAQLQGDLAFDPEDVQNEILHTLLDKSPMLEDVLNEKELDSTGKMDTKYFGFKYQSLIGYRFGKYKNLKKKESGLIFF